jgi:hypothetical protein
VIAAVYLDPPNVSFAVCKKITNNFEIYLKSGTLQKLTENFGEKGLCPLNRKSRYNIEAR